MSTQDEKHRNDNLAKADKIKAAAASQTEPGTLSEASKTEGPEKPDDQRQTDDALKTLTEAVAKLNSDINGNGTVTLTERVKSLEDAVKTIVDTLAAKSPDHGPSDHAQRLEKIERRLEQQFGAA